MFSLPKKGVAADAPAVIDYDGESVRVESGPFMVVRAFDEKVLEAAASRPVCIRLPGLREWLYLNRGAEAHVVDVPGWGHSTCFIGAVVTFKNWSNASPETTGGPPEAGASARRVACLGATLGTSAATLSALDAAHRRYLCYLVAKGGCTVAVQAVAGGGKTTSLLSAIKSAPAGKRFILTAFNRALVQDMKDKVLAWGLERKALVSTFDALVRAAYLKRFGGDCGITDLRASNVHVFAPFFEGKPFGLRKAYVDRFSAFCNSTHADPEQFCVAEGYEKGAGLLRDLWDAGRRGELLTFDVLRKRAVAEDWFDPYLQSKADAVLCDEAQDLDPGMIELLNRNPCQTVYVGDPRQGIYGFRNAVDAFTRLPGDTVHLELFCTFRVAAPAVDQISKETGAPMAYAGPERRTIMTRGGTPPWGPDDEYVYLFRGWKALLTTARDLPGINITGYSEERVAGFAKTRGKPPRGGADADEGEDLPSFVRSLDAGALQRLIQDIRGNWSEAPRVTMSTVHSFKGLEAAKVRLGADVSKTKDNLYYVAVTRGFEHTHLDLADGAPVARMDQFVFNPKSQAF